MRPTITCRPRYTCRTCGAGLSSAGRVGEPPTFFHSGPTDHPARPRLMHDEVDATDLRDGDLMRIGPSTNYVLVADAQTGSDGRIDVTIYNGSEPNDAPTLRLDPHAKVSLSMRGARP